MKATIFYSWQSDTRAAANRTLIQDALELAAKDIANDGSIGIEPVIDRDTVNVPGAPDIGATILDKIRSADLVVADVSIINAGSTGRLTPNPNVMLEVGYAIATLGEPRIVLVQNQAFGPSEQLPFDLRQKRVLSYSSPEDAGERAEERRKLRVSLRDAIGTILAHARRKTAAPALGISLDYVTATKSRELHEYRLMVTVQNFGTKLVRDFYVEVEIPTALLDRDETYTGIVHARSDRSTTFFRFANEDEDGSAKIYPGDSQTVFIPYKMDDKTYHDERANLFNQQVRARVYVHGELAASAERGVVDLQCF